MLGVEGHVVPVVAAVGVVGVVGVAVLLLLVDEGPLLIELDLAGLGGKSHQLVVGGLGVLTGQQGQPRDRVLVDPDQAGRLADAAPLGQVLQDRQDLVVRQLGVEQRRPLELGEPGLAGLAVEQPVAGLAEVVADREVAPAPPPYRGQSGFWQQKRRGRPWAWVIPG